jgi:hypothetical protein
VKTKAFLITLLWLWLLPCAVWAQGVPAFKARQDLLDFYRSNYIQNLGSMQELDVFRDGTVSHGFISLHGTSTTVRTDPLALAQELASGVTFLFQIPADYQWVVGQGGLLERKPIETIDTWKNVVMGLQIDGVLLEDGYVSIMVDEQGRLRTLTISVPRLRPETVTTVRSTPIAPAVAQARISADANTLPEGNLFNIKPNTALTFVDFRKIALAREPFVVYRTTVNRAYYTVNGKTGAVTRVSTMR